MEIGVKLNNIHIDMFNGVITYEGKKVMFDDTKCMMGIANELYKVGAWISRNVHLCDYNYAYRKSMIGHNILYIVIDNYNYDNKDEIYLDGTCYNMNEFISTLNLLNMNNADTAIEVCKLKHGDVFVRNGLLGIECKLAVVGD